VGRERLAWLVTVPIAVAGSEAAHALANTAFGSPTGPSGELVEGRGPGAHLVPALGALVLAAITLGLVARVAGAWGAGRRASAAPFVFACLPPALYGFQEHLELGLHSGAVPLAAVLEPTFLPGLVLQVPFALAAYVLARLLIGLADGVRGLIGRRGQVHVPPVRGAAVPRARDASPRRSFAGQAHCGRGPPLIAAPA